MSVETKNQNNLSTKRTILVPPENPYVILHETNEEEMESWYYFLKWKGNEKNLIDLEKQLSSVRWFLYPGLGTFDLDLEHKVSEYTAKEMTKPDLNSCTFHRKFDGVLQPINLNFQNKDKNKRKIKKVCEILGIGSIENFIDEEDIDPEDLAEENSGDESSSTDFSETDSDSSTDDSDHEKTHKKKSNEIKARNIKELTEQLKNTGMNVKRRQAMAKRMKKNNG